MENKNWRQNNFRLNSTNNNKKIKSSIQIKIDIGKISFYDENKGFGFIESKNNGSIYFHKTNFSNITCFLKTDTEVKFQFSKNLRQNGKCNYSVFKKTLEILG
ncbi:MAG: cold shock domain-containing protein [Spirochaetaceae bacterium]|nr:cold shock domain-containing protein [Spirochaetaceae bacterium]